jgi:hypothetical protein
VYWRAGSRQYACHLTPDTCSLFSILYCRTLALPYCVQYVFVWFADWGSPREFFSFLSPKLLVRILGRIPSLASTIWDSRISKFRNRPRLVIFVLRRYYLPNLHFIKLQNSALVSFTSSALLKTSCSKKDLYLLLKSPLCRIKQSYLSGKTFFYPTRILIHLIIFLEIC